MDGRKGLLCVFTCHHVKGLCLQFAQRPVKITAREKLKRIKNKLFLSNNSLIIVFRQDCKSKYFTNWITTENPNRKGKKKNNTAGKKKVIGPNRFDENMKVHFTLLK